MKSERYDNGEIWLELHVSQSCILQTICTNDFMDRSTTNAVRHYSKLQSSREDTNNSEIKQSKTWYGQTQNAEVESSRSFWRIQLSLVLQSIGLSIRPKFESQHTAILQNAAKICEVHRATLRAARGAAIQSSIWSNRMIASYRTQSHKRASYRTQIAISR